MRNWYLSKWREAQLTYGVCLPSPWSWVNFVCGARVCAGFSCILCVIVCLLGAYMPAACMRACVHAAGMFPWLCLYAECVCVFCACINALTRYSWTTHSHAHTKQIAQTHTHRRYRVTGCGCIHWKREWQKRCSSSSIAHIHEVYLHLRMRKCKYVLGCV